MRIQKRQLMQFLFITILFIVWSDCSFGQDIAEKKFGTMEDGSAVHLITLKNRQGMEVSVTSYGGIVTSVKVPDRDGNNENVVLGFKELGKYQQSHPFFGAIVGRYANRIAGGMFKLNGEIYELATNDGENHLHGGNRGFDKVLWDYEVNESDNSVTLTYFSRDGEEGYPGNLDVSVTYTLTDENELKIDYTANTDQPTVINLTNHSYFNLSGDQTEGILNHFLSVDADRYTPVDKGLIPTGELRPVEETPFDFRKAKQIGADIDRVEGGYDHNFVLNDANERVRKVAALEHRESGRVMEVYTDKPGMQLYTGNFLNGSLRDRKGRPIGQHAALCLETQYFPNSPNQPDFPSPVLEENETYRTTTIYRFTVSE